MPRALFDGDYTQPQIVDFPKFEVPFKADPKPYVYKLKFWQHFASIVEPAIGSPAPQGGGEYVGGDAATFKGIGGGIVEFEREYAFIPATRSEFESYAYSVQFVQTICPDLLTEPCKSSVGEAPETFVSRIQFEYWKTDDPAALQRILPRAPKAFQLFETVILTNGFGTFHVGDEILAEDASMKLWKGQIFEVQKRFITIPPWWF